MHNSFKSKSIKIITVSVLLVFANFSFAAQQTGRKAAQKYFSKRGANNAKAGFKGSAGEYKSSSSARTPTSAGSPRYLAMHFGVSLSDKSHSWGPNSPEEDIAQWNLGVTYRIGEWVNSMDLLLRVDVFGLEPAGKSVNKIAILPVLAFPDGNSSFPVYFGAGLGLGFFFEQLDDESYVTLEYQLLVGVRFFDVLGSWGLTGEVGLKNNVHLTSDGQYSGTFLSVGTVSRF